VAPPGATGEGVIAGDGEAPSDAVSVPLAPPLGEGAAPVAEAGADSDPRALPEAVSLTGAEGGGVGDVLRERAGPEAVAEGVAGAEGEARGPLAEGTGDAVARGDADTEALRLPRARDAEALPVDEGEALPASGAPPVVPLAHPLPLPRGGEGVATDAEGAPVTEPDHEGVPLPVSVGAARVAVPPPTPPAVPLPVADGDDEMELLAPPLPTADGDAEALGEGRAVGGAEGDAQGEGGGEGVAPPLPVGEALAEADACVEGLGVSVGAGALPLGAPLPLPLPLLEGAAVDEAAPLSVPLRVAAAEPAEGRPLPLPLPLRAGEPLPLPAGEAL
jgi:hypothetical protein